MYQLLWTFELYQKLACCVKMRQNIQNVGKGRGSVVAMVTRKSHCPGKMFFLLAVLVVVVV